MPFREVGQKPDLFPKIINPTEIIMDKSNSMRKLLMNAFWIAIMIGGLMFVGNMHFCNAQNDKSTSTFSATLASGENGNLELTLTMNKTSYSLGDPVNLTLTITNISNQTINYTHTGLDFDFQVNNGTNNIVYKWSNFKAIAQFITIAPLPAGESISANFTWQQICNFNAQVEGDPVSPGTYNVIGETGPTYNIQTIPLPITILGVPISTSTPSPTPSVPEFPAIAVLAIFLVLSLFAVTMLSTRKRRICKN